MRIGLSNLNFGNQIVPQSSVSPITGRSVKRKSLDQCHGILCINITLHLPKASQRPFKKKKNTALITYTLRNILRLVASCYYEFFFVFQSALGELVSDPPTFPRVKHLFNGSYCIP